MTHSTVLFSNATTHSTVASLCTGVPSAPILQLHPPAQQASARNRLQFIMRLFLIVSTALFFHLSVQASSATRDTILTGQALAVNDKLVSKNGRYALGFFETRSKSSEGTTNWYLGIWFNTVPKFTLEHARVRDAAAVSAGGEEDDGDLGLMAHEALTGPGDRASATRLCGGGPDSDLASPGHQRVNRSWESGNGSEANA